MLYIDGNSPTYFNLEDGGSIYLQNDSNIAHNNMVYHPKNMRA
jgi:hypothetical protein